MSHALTLPFVKVVVHALLLFDEVMCAAETCDLEQAQRGTANELFESLEPRAHCQGVAMEMPVTPAEVMFASDMYIHNIVIPYNRGPLFMNEKKRGHYP